MSRSLTGGRPGRETTGTELHRELDCSGGKLIFTVLRERNVALLLDDSGVRAIRVIRAQESRMGGIYLGKIRNVAQNINACFVEIQPGELCFLSLRDAESAHLTNRAANGTLKAGDELPVMVTRDAQKTKKASVTADPGRIKQLLAADTRVEDTGEVLRTIFDGATHKMAYSVLWEPVWAYAELLDGWASPAEYGEILTDDPVLWKKLNEYQHPVLTEKKLRLYEDPAISLRLLYSLERGLSEALDTRVWLPCGGYLVIEPTEALTVIDVNSGKNESRKTGEDTYFQVNREAAKEVARQLRLRNLSGIIIVDFINMEDREQQKELLAYLRQLTAPDLRHPRVVDMTPLGLVEITRKKTHPTLAEQFRQ